MAIVDVAWGPMFVAVAIALAVGSPDRHSWLLAGLVTVWGGRLSWHIASRSRRVGDHPRRSTPREGWPSRASGSRLDSMDAVEAAFDAHPREGFLPASLRRRAAHDGPLGIPADQTNSQPRTVDAMLRLLELHRGHRVLDVGSGSGWTTALLAHLVGATGEVVGVELEPELVEFGGANLAATHQPWARIRRATPGVLGDPEHAPYDRILVSAEPRDLPEPLVGQLAATGRMVIPVAGRMTLVVMPGPVVTQHGAYRFVPLR